MQHACITMALSAAIVSCSPPVHRAPRAEAVDPCRRNEDLDPAQAQELAREVDPERFEVGPPAIELVENALRACERRWERMRDREEVDCSGDPLAPREGAEVAGAETVLAQRAGDLLVVDWSDCPMDARCSRSVARYSISTCRWIEAAVQWGECAPVNDIEVDTGGVPELEAALLGAFGRAGDPMRASDGVSHLLATGHRAFRAAVEMQMSEGDLECDSFCLGPAFRLPPWRRGRPVVPSNESTFWRGRPPRFVLGTLAGGFLPLPSNGALQLERFGFGDPGRICTEAYVVYDPARDRHRWLGAHYFLEPIYDPIASHVVQRGRYLLIDHLFVDLREGVGALVSDVEGVRLDAIDPEEIASALRSGQCNVGCRE